MNKTFEYFERRLETTLNDLKLSAAQAKDPDLNGDFHPITIPHP